MNEKPVRIAIGRAQRSAARPCLVAAVLSVLVGLPLTPASAATSPGEKRAYLEQARWGDPTTVRLPGGVHLSGEFRGLFGAWEEGDAYALRYESWRQAQPPLRAPRLGAAVTLVTATGDTVRGPLAGVAPSMTVLGSANPQAHAGVLTTRVVAARIDAAELDSTAWQEQVAAWEQAPTLDAVALEGSGRLWVVPADRVADVSVADLSKDSPATDNPAVAIPLVAVGLGVGYVILRFFFWPVIQVMAGETHT